LCTTPISQPTGDLSTTWCWFIHNKYYLFVSFQKPVDESVEFSVDDLILSVTLADLSTGLSTGYCLNYLVITNT
jgi:transposase